MSQSLVVVSRCVAGEGVVSTFRFRGVYKGNRISKILVKSGRKSDLVTGRDYILFLKLIRIDRANLVTYLVKYKDIS